MSVNKVILIGNVGAEPEVRYLDTNMCVARVRVATSERGYVLKNGTQVPERTEWHNVVFWNKQGEYVEKYVHTGDTIYVEGKLQYRTRTDKQGINRTSVEIMANAIEILISRKDEGGSKPKEQAKPENKEIPQSNQVQTEEPPF